MILLVPIFVQCYRLSADGDLDAAYTQAKQAMDSAGDLTLAIRLKGWMLKCFITKKLLDV